MLHSLLFVLPAFELLVQATEGYSQLSTPPHRRQLMTCDQIYGNGSIPCGGSDSTWCYNPNLGQTCCPLDSGFCNSGSYCAPVAGYCCFEDEDLATCAERAGFDLPNGTANSRIPDPGPVMAGPSRSSRTFTVTPFLTAGPRPTLTNTPDPDGDLSGWPSNDPFEEPFDAQTFTVELPATCHETRSFSASVVVQISNTTVSLLTPTSTSVLPSVEASTSVLPLVRVSIAVKEGRSLIGSILVVAAVSVRICELLVGDGDLRV
ncbi:hypothetical protein GGR58DRAFT_511492 [Xylaria digitata]|nr:hypothetical protein GGR58DRAFT_511492 [Xylaria digitata]